VLLIIGSVCGLLPDSIVNFNYCSLNNLCTSGRSHVACTYARPNLGPSCPPKDQVTFADFNQTRIDLVLDTHNDYRNRIASGQVAGYPKAARMLTLNWEDTLAYFSEANTRQCVMKHDTCRRTSNYTYVGQNICKTYSVDLKDPEYVIKNCIDLWFLENQNIQCPIQYVDKCCPITPV
jgi:hypothetical protein